MLQDELAKELGISKSQLSKFKARGCPVGDTGEAKNWIATKIRKRAKRTKATADSATVTAQDIPPAQEPEQDASHTWAARVGRARRMEVALYEAAAIAVSRKEYNQLTTLIGNHTKAAQNIAELEATALERQIQAGELIHRDTVRAVMAELLTPIRNALDLLPVTERSRCNPADPKVAEDTLRAWKDALLLKVSQAATKF